MIIKKYFPSLIGISVFDKHSLYEDKLFKKCLSIKDKTKSGGDNWLSNQTYNTLGTFNFLQDKTFSPIKKFILTSIKRYCSDLDIDESKLNMNPKDAWFNYYEQGNYQEFHIHQSALSLVYLLKGNNEGSKLVFKTPLNPMFHVPYKSFKEDTFRTLSFDMVPGTLVIFDSSLEHCVTQHNSFEPRITLSLNLYLK
jgi:uncharacterized protein (TIGR02466 family)